MYKHGKSEKVSKRSLQLRSFCIELINFTIIASVYLYNLLSSGNLFLTFWSVKSNLYKEMTKVSFFSPQ